MSLKLVALSLIGVATKVGAVLAVAALMATPIYAHVGESDERANASAPTGEKPKQLEGVGIDEKLGQNLDLGLTFKDENGQTVTLGSYYDGKKPVIVSPVYYSCPGLCNFHLNGLTDALKEMDWSTGEKYTVLAISFDPKEGPPVAKAKKENYMKIYGRPGTENGWHFLTGDEATVKKFTESIGFRYHWDENEMQWAHASAAIVTSPEGKITRYLPGILFDSKDVKFALIEGGQGKVGTFIEQLVLFCFHYNPQQSKYTVAVFNIMKIGGLITVLLLAILLFPVWIRARKETEV